MEFNVFYFDLNVFYVYALNDDESTTTTNNAPVMSSTNWRPKVYFCVTTRFTLWTLQKPRSVR